MTTPEITAAINAEITRLNGLPRTEFINRVLSLDIDPDAVTVDDQHPANNGISMSIYNGLTRSISLRDGLTPKFCAEFVQDNAELIARVMAGLDREWDGSNYRGTLTADAANAERELIEIVETINTEYYLWEAGHILQELDPREWLDPVRVGVRNQATAESAVKFAVDGMESDGVAPYGEGNVWLNREAVAHVAREWWTEAHEEDE